MMTPDEQARIEVTTLVERLRAMTAVWSAKSKAGRLVREAADLLARQSQALTTATATLDREREIDGEVLR